MIDFTNCIEEFNSYKGIEKKKTLIYDNKITLKHNIIPIEVKSGERYTFSSLL